MIDTINLIGYSAGTIQTVRTVPQIFSSIKRRSTRDLSFWMIILSILGTLLWLMYGISTTSMPIIITDSISLFLLCMLLLIKIRFDKT